jgi:soluble lytic murein transglycosylase-like protein
VLRSAARHGVDARLVQAVIRHESNWNPTARSPKGALGLMQLMPDTARLLGVDPLNPEQNIEGGTRFLAGLLVAFDGDLDAALTGYVAGPAFARAWRRGEIVPGDEVSTYVRNVKASYRATAGGAAARGASRVALLGPAG